MACCTNCTLVRVKNKRGGLATHYDAAGTSFNFATPPTVPQATVSNPKNGDTLIEYYDNALAFWTHNGTAWTLDFYHSTIDKFNTNYLASGNMSDNPLVPQLPPSNPVLGNTLLEKYNNGQIFWTYNGTSWTRDYIISSGNKTTFTSQVGSTLNESSLPATPITAPTGANVGDTLVEHYGNADVFWTYNGSTWVRNFYSTKCCTTLDEVGGTFNPSSPVVPTTPGTNGNALIEHYDNGTVYWQHNGITWVYQFSQLEGTANSHAHNDETGNDFSVSTPPANPVNPPVTSVANDTLVEHFDNGNIFWTYNGTDWVIDWVDTECCTLVDTVSGNIPPTFPTTPSTLPSNPAPDTLLIEHYDNGTIYWTYDGNVWSYQFHETTGNVHTHSNEVATSVNFASLPIVPLSQPTTSNANDTLVEHYANADIYWTYNGTNWIRDWVNNSNQTYLQDVNTTFNPAVLPLNPATSPLGATVGDVLIEHYDNGIIYWTYDGSNWDYQFHQVEGENGNIALHHDETGSDINFNLLPASPITIPSGSNVGDTIIEHYDNGTVYWTFNGTVWVRDWVDSNAATTLSNNPATNVPGSAPVTPPSSPSAGDVHIEHYATGDAFWQYNGTSWDLVFFSPASSGAYNTNYDASGNSINANSLPTNPISPPAGVVANHTLHENYDNGQLFWTFNGTNWVLDYAVTSGCCLTIDNQDEYNCNNPPAAPVNPPTVPHAGDKHYEYFYNTSNRLDAILIWQYSGSVWLLFNTQFFPQEYIVDYHETDEIDILGVANGTAHNAPIVSTTVGYVNGDRIVERFSNGSIEWKLISCTWVRTFIDRTCDCCESIDIVPVLSADTQDICIGGTVNFEEDSIFLSTLSTACVWQATTWNFGDGSTATGRNVSHTFATEGLYSVTAAITCSGGLTESHIIYVKVSSVHAEFIVSDESPSANSNVTFTSISNVNGCAPTYTWNFGDGSTFIGLVPPAHQYTNTGSFTASLTITCTNGCTDVYQKTINVGTSAIEAGFTVADNTISVGQSTQLTDTSTATGCTINGWVWEYSTNSGTTWTQFSTQQSPIFSPPAAGNYNVRLTAACSNGDTDFVVQNISVSTVTPSMTVSNDNVDIGETIIVTSTSTSVNCTIVSQSWSVSVDGAAATPFGTGQITQNYIPTSEGTHSIILTVTCGDGTVRSIAYPIQVNADGLVIANPTLSVSTVCINNSETVQFTDNSTADGCSVDTWLWEVDNGAGGAFTSFSTLQFPPPFAPTTGGTYRVRLTVTCSSSGATDITQTQFTANNITANFTGLTSPQNVGATVTLTDATVVEGPCAVDTWTWRVSTNNGASYNTFATTQNATYTFGTAGTYLFRLIAACPTCEDLIQVGPITVSATGVIAPALAINNTTLCINSGQTATFTDASTSPNCTIDTWLWEIDDGAGGAYTTYSTLQNPPAFVPPTGGTYRVRLTVTCSSSGETATTAVSTIAVNNIAASFTGLGAGPYNVGDTINFVNTSTNNGPCTINSWTWRVSTDGGTTYTTFATTQNANYQFPAAGNYRFRLVAGCNTCTDIRQQGPVTVNAVLTPLVIASFTTPDTTIGANVAAPLTNTSSAVNCNLSTQSWTVSVNGGAAIQFSTAFSPTYTPTVAGSHVITLTQLCDGGANDTETLTIEAATVTAGITATPSTVTQGSPVAVTNTTTSANCTGAALTYSHEFSTNGGLTWTQYSTATNPTYTPTTAGNHLLRVVSTCPTHSVSNTSPSTAITVNSSTLAGLCYRDITSAVTQWDFSTMIPNNVARTEINTTGRTVTVNDGNGGTVNVTMQAVENSTGSGGYGHSGTSDAPRLTLGVDQNQLVTFTFNFSKVMNLTVDFETLREGERLNVASNGIITFHHPTELGPTAVVTGNGTSTMDFDATATVGGAGGNPGIVGALTLTNVTTVTFAYTSDDTSGSDNVKLLFKALNNNIVYYNDPDSDGLNVIRVSDNANVGAVNTAWEQIDCSSI